MGKFNDPKIAVGVLQFYLKHKIMIKMRKKEKKKKENYKGQIRQPIVIENLEIENICSHHHLYYICIYTPYDLNLNS